VRGSDRLWSAEPQFLASRGWRVLEVEYRGSTGFGWKHFHAGWKQWGLAMQDDLADAVAWAAQQKLADPARVCIVGASYGGYAALMGPIRHPGTYRCAASYAGVTDIALRFNATWSDLGDQNRRFTLPQLMGDPARDAAQFAATSPLQRVAEIKVPVLLAQGVHDRRVPPEHADRFMQAARAAGVQVERVDYDEGHTWVETRHHADFLRRLEAFVRAAFAR
jgi:dipeptidyl aminopeptidase/acylaminoacyl peptidase